MPPITRVGPNPVTLRRPAPPTPTTSLAKSALDIASKAKPTIHRGLESLETPSDVFNNFYTSAENFMNWQLKNTDLLPGEALASRKLLSEFKTVNKFAGPVGNAITFGSALLSDNPFENTFCSAISSVAGTSAGVAAGAALAPVSGPGAIFGGTVAATGAGYLADEACHAGFDLGENLWETYIPDEFKNSVDSGFDLIRDTTLDAFRSVSDIFF